MTVTVLYFGPAADWVGAAGENFELVPGATLVQLAAALADRHPAIRFERAGVRFAVNERFAGPDTVLRDGDEIAIIPPVSGGQDEPVWVDLVRAPIELARIRAWIGGDPCLGGIVTFDGITRAESDDTHGPLLHLDYAAYEGMALRQLRDLADRAMADFGAGRVALLHRLGVVPPGEVSVSIAVACPHRAAAFDACRRLIDELKQDVPIWKKDVYQDGAQRWVEPKH